MKSVTVWDRTDRLAGLRRFAVAISVLNILGHTVLGSSSRGHSWRSRWRAPTPSSCFWSSSTRGSTTGHPASAATFAPGWTSCCRPISRGLPAGMLIYANDQLWPFAFAAATAISSKALIRMSIKGSMRHVFNPSNLGITVTLLLFPMGRRGAALPVHREARRGGRLGGPGDPGLPRDIPEPALHQADSADRRVARVLHPAGGGAHLLPRCPDDPGADADHRRRVPSLHVLHGHRSRDDAKLDGGQIIYGASVAIVYSLLVVFHIVFGLFFALTIVCSLRAIALYVAERRAKMAGQKRAGEGRRGGSRKAASGASGTGGSMSPSIAIVGMACQYADASSPAELWNNALAGRRAFRRMPSVRMNPGGLSLR